MSNERRSKPTEDGRGSKRAEVLAEVIEDQARREAAREAATVARSKATDSGLFMQVSLLVFGTFFFYLLLFSPGWIAPPGPDPITAAAIDDGLRVSIFLTARQIETFRENEGRLPANIDEAGGGRAGVVYRRIDARTFQLSATTRDTALTYVSTDALEEFIGSALRVLEGRS